MEQHLLNQYGAITPLQTLDNPQGSRFRGHFITSDGSITGRLPSSHPAAAEEAAKATGNPFTHTSDFLAKTGAMRFEVYDGHPGVQFFGKPTSEQLSTLGDIAKVHGRGLNWERSNAKGASVKDGQNFATLQRHVLLSKAFVLIKSAGPFRFASTQVNVDENTADTIRSWARDLIDPNDLADDGFEKDVHITVRYGVLDDDPVKVANALRPLSSITARVGKLACFSSDQHDVLYLSIDSPDLVKANRLISSGVACRPSDHGPYVPHLTIAYLHPGAAQRYLADHGPDVDDMVFDSVALSGKGGQQTSIRLQGPRRPEYGRQWANRHLIRPYGSSLLASVDKP